jgi:hypothetical protein
VGETLSERSVVVFAEPLAQTSSLSQEVDWVPVSQTALEGLSRFRQGWDGFGAVAPTEGSLQMAQRVLRHVPDYAPRPRILPTTDGGIQIEWYRQGMDITLEVMGPLEVTLFWRDDVAEWEGPLDESPELFTSLLWRFVVS